MERFASLSPRLREKGIHVLLALLMVVGLLMPVLGTLLPDFPPLKPLLLTACVVLILEALSASRVSAVIGAVLIPLSLCLWLFTGSGLVTLTDLFIAVSLRFSGQQAALPLVANEAAVFLAVLAGAVAWFSTLPKATYLPALMLCAAGIMLVWLTGSGALTPWLLFSLAAVLLLLIRDRHEQSPLLRIFPWIALVAALAFLIAPKNGLVIEPLKNKADELRQMILDRLFFTEPRDVFSLSVEGYYPQGTGQLGGKPELNDHPVLQVSAPRTVYLRGVILNEYDGHAWRNTTGGRRYLWQSSSLASTRIRLFDQELPSLSSDNTLLTPASVSVRMLSDSASTLFVPQRIRELTPGGGLVPYFSNSSEVFVTRNLQAGDTWTVSAPLFLAGDPGLGTLIDAASSFGDSHWQEIVDTYTALPSHLEEPVYALAREIASVASTPYEKALTIQSWLSRNCRYTLEVEDHPVNVDFVTRFLLDTREGYCTYFASAMTVLCRMVGLPARYVEGYAADPDENGQALVTGLSAHAWTEVCFEGFGWLTFDATPRQRRSGDGSGEPSASEPEATPTPPPETPTEEPTPEPTEEPTEEPSGGSEDDATDSSDPSTSPPPDSEPTEAPATETPSAEPEASPDPSDEPDADDPDAGNPDDGSASPLNQDPFSLPWLLLLILALIAALALRFRISSPVHRDRKAKTDEARFRVWSQEVIDLLKAEDLTRRVGETPMSFTRRIDHSGRFTVSLSPIGECLSLIHYGGVKPLEEDISLLRNSAQALRKELSAPARLRYWLCRLFVPLRRHAKW